MKNNFFKLVAGFALIGAITTGCSSTKESTDTTDSTMVDSTGSMNQSTTDTVSTAPSGTMPTDTVR